MLSLEPEFDAGRHVLTLALVLHRTGENTEAPNLLQPTGRSHGLQAYDFAADDLTYGVKKPAFGDKRTMSLKNLELLIQIIVSKATVSQISAGNYQLDALDPQSKSTTPVSESAHPFS